MTEAEFLNLLLTPKTRKASKPKGHGEGGKFKGRLGTLVRSRKGRPHRKANGYIRYINTDAEWRRNNLGIH